MTNDERRRDLCVQRTRRDAADSSFVIRHSSFPPTASEPQKDFPSIHPPDDEPHDEQHRAALQRRDPELAEAGEDLLAEMNAQLLADEAGAHLKHGVERDRVEADDDQREGPAFPTAAVDDRD